MAVRNVACCSSQISLQSSSSAPPSRPCIACYTYSLFVVATLTLLLGSPHTSLCTPHTASWLPSHSFLVALTLLLCIPHTPPLYPSRCVLLQGSPEALSSLLYCDFLDPGADPPRYVEVPTLDKLLAVLRELLGDYNAQHRSRLDLVLFLYAAQHICRISRIIR